MITSLKQAEGLKGKSPIAKVIVQATAELQAILEKEPAQITASARATDYKFNAEGIEYTATSREGLAVAIIVE